MSSSKRSPLKTAGQSLVEFAFILPVLLLMMVAIIDFGILLYAQMTVTNAAWEGARAGATVVDPTRGDQEITGAVQAAAYGLDLSRLTINIDPAQNESPRDQPYPAPRGAPLSVTVQYKVELSFLPLTLLIRGRATTQMEYQNP